MSWEMAWYHVMWYKPLYQWGPPHILLRLNICGPRLVQGFVPMGPCPTSKKQPPLTGAKGPCLRTMSMAMPTDHGHGHAYGPWPWPCLGTPDHAPSSVEEKEREIGQPASLKKQSPVTWRHEPLALTSGRLAHSHGTSQSTIFQKDTLKKIICVMYAKTIKETRSNIHSNHRNPMNIDETTTENARTTQKTTERLRNQRHSKETRGIFKTQRALNRNLKKIKEHR